ncbi:hypothetical protein G9F72_018345 [Clostridium estertheticum]|uniref:hypothetical protein n=1 Tax=Clostridium estertheticum TaxID=238834 RepID=UPI0013E931EA|nr:hypothetical protein [Clostridium estertheticum]MBZ9688294.1 hypothetical protein [Clostridium estertheticum]
MKNATKYFIENKLLTMMMLKNYIIRLYKIKKFKIEIASELGIDNYDWVINDIHSPNQKYLVGFVVFKTSEVS